MEKDEERIALSIEKFRQTKKRMLVVAHRGCSGRAPENTLAAFEMALELGADMIECDVRLTKDDEVIVFHDRTLNRTTNGRGRVEDRTLKELKDLDAGFWFNSRFSGERIPTLDELLHLLDERGLLNIELKADSHGHQSLTTLEDRVLDAIRHHHAEGRVFLGSFNHRLIRGVKERHPCLATAVIYKATRDFAIRPSRLVSRAKADAFVCGRWWLSKRFLEDLRNHRIPVFVYTVNRERDVNKMARLRVDGVITNYPEMVTKALERLPEV